MIIFGFLFLLYLQITFTEITTDAIFIGAGVLFIRKATIDRKQAKIQEQITSKKKNQGKNTQPKTGTKKVR